MYIFFSHRFAMTDSSLAMFFYGACPCSNALVIRVIIIIHETSVYIQNVNQLCYSVAFFHYDFLGPVIQHCLYTTHSTYINMSYTALCTLLIYLLTYLWSIVNGRSPCTVMRLPVFTAQCTLVHMCGLGIACRPSVRLSVTLVDCDHISWKSWKLIARSISPTPSLFVAKRRSTYSQGNMGKFGGD